MTTAHIQAGFVVNPALTVIRSSDDEIVVRFGSRSTVSRRLKDDSRSGRLGDLIESFSIARSIESVLAEEADDESVRRMIDTLIDQKVLIDEEAAASEYVALGLGLSDGTAVASATVAVVGTGAIASSLAVQLADGGATVRTEESVNEEVFESSDFLVVASDTPDIGLFFDANELALTLDRPWQAVFVDGAECVVGPLFRPGHTACFHDFDVMDESARSLRLDYLYLKSARVAERPSLPKFIADLAASYATVSTLQHLGGKGSFLEGFVMRIDLERLEIIRDQVLQMPRCPACIQNRPHLRHPFI